MKEKQILKKRVEEIKRLQEAAKKASRPRDES